MAAKRKATSAPVGRREELLVRVEEAQRKAGCVSEGFIFETAQSLGLPVSEVYGVTTFYSFLSVKPLGRNVIRVCKSVPCYLKHVEMIIQNVEKVLGILPGETTEDGRFSLELTNCIGACDKAPAMLINDEVHGHLTAEKIAEILKSYK
jgi:NADH:ubiquinone oxidoreductase subunit E